MQKEQLNIRFAQPSDTSVIFSFINELAVYEKMADQVIGNEMLLHEALFIKKHAEVILAELDGIPVGFALFFHNFSTFQTRANLYLEDLFVLKEYRHKGIGKKLLTHLAKIAIERGCLRLDWSCLTWNQPSIDFYRKIGATSLDDWMTFRIIDQALVDLAHLDT